MKKLLLLAVMVGVSGCVTPSPEEIAIIDKKREEEARLLTQNRLQKEQELNNYIANKSEVICKSQGFKLGTKDLAQCANVTATELRMQIAYQNQLAEKQKKQEKSEALDKFFEGIKEATDQSKYYQPYNASPGFTCHHMGDFTTCN